MAPMRDIKRSNETRHAAGSSWTETFEEPGLSGTRIVAAGDWVLTRTDCFCCSCPESGSSDPYCRNHGFAGERSCDHHELPGQADEEGRMPESVQAHRLTHAH